MPAGTSRMQRPSTLSLVEQGAGSSSAHMLLGTSLPSSHALRQRRDNNWESFRDLVEDASEDEESDTDTIRPSPRLQARKQSSMRSLRSIFTPRSARQTTRSRPWSIASPRQEEQPLTADILSSSPPQMNGFSRGIEETLDQVADGRTSTMQTKQLESEEGHERDDQDATDAGVPLLPKPKATSTGTGTARASSGEYLPRLTVSSLG